MGVVLVLLRHFALVPGALTLVIGANGAVMAFLGFNPELVPMALLAGVIADALHAGLKPAIGPGPGPGVDGSATGGSGGRPAAFRAFACGVPAIYYALYFAALGLTEGVAWSLHLWTGAIVLAGLAGLLVSYAMVPTTAAAGASPATHPARRGGDGSNASIGGRRLADRRGRRRRGRCGRGLSPRDTRHCRRDVHWRPCSSVSVVSARCRSSTHTARPGTRPRR